MTRKELEQDAPTTTGATEPGNAITGEDFGDVAPASVPEWLFGKSERKS